MITRPELKTDLVLIDGLVDSSDGLMNGMAMFKGQLYRAIFQLDSTKQNATFDYACYDVETRFPA